MNKNFIKKDKYIVASKKNFYLKLGAFFLIALVCSIIFSIYSNTYILKILKDSYVSNLELNDKIITLKEEIIKNKNYIEKLEINNKEANDVFEKYTDAIKYKLATAEEVKSELFKREEEKLELQREINYYKFLYNSKHTNNLISIEKFIIKPSNIENFYEYSFLILSNKSNMEVKAKYQIYYLANEDIGNKKSNRISFDITKNSINFKNFQMVSGKLKINKKNTFNTIYLDVNYKGKIYNFNFEIL